MGTLIMVEFTKLRTIRSPWLLIGIQQVVIIAALSGFVTGGMVNVHDASATRLLLSHGGLISAIFTLLLSLNAVAGEYRHRTITDTYLATPRRNRVIIAKLIAYAIGGAVVGLLGVVTAVIVAALWLAGRGGAISLNSGEALRAMAGGVAASAAYAAIGVSVGALVRNLTGAVAIALIWILVVETIVRQLVSGVGRWLPFASGSALAHTPPAGATLSQWSAGLVLAGYAAVFALVAALTSVRRDVT